MSGVGPTLPPWDGILTQPSPLLLPPPSPFHDPVFPPSPGSLQEQEETLLDYEDADEAQETGAGAGGAAKKCGCRDAVA